MQTRFTKETADAALGRRKAELVLKGGMILNVFTNRVEQADVAIVNGIIVGVGEFAGEQEVDMSGKYLVPGFIDAHLHLESTLVNPAELVHYAGLWGTTAFIIDPHEAANVSGTKGIDYMMAETADAQADVYVMLPSCVPAAENEDNGFTLTAELMAPYKQNPRVLGLAEVMDSQAVFAGRPDMLDKLELFADRIIDGHAGYFSARETGCYRLAGIRTDHECTTYADALREMSAGMQILVREGTAAKNLEAIISGVVKDRLPCHQLAFCTDDKHMDEIQREGHISANIRKAIKLGLDPIEAYKIAAYYPAVCYGLKHIGAVCPGYDANLVVLDDLQTVAVCDVYYHGRRLAKDKYQPEGGFSVPPELLNTVHLKDFPVTDLQLPVKPAEALCIEIIPGQILTKKYVGEVPAENGLFISRDDFLKIAVLERHRATGKMGLGILKGFGLKNGAIASTVGHDSHNLIVAGDSDRDMYLAISALKECGGGYALVENGQLYSVLKLEVMGLMSREPYEKVRQNLRQMLEKARQMGVPEETDPFITLSFLALPVIPELRITPRGLFDVGESAFKKLQ